MFHELLFFHIRLKFMELDSQRVCFFFICDPLTKTYTSLIYDILFNPVSDTLFEFLHGVGSEIQPLNREGVFRKSSFEFHERLGITLNVTVSKS